jgi:hypothetical protein
MTLADLKQLVSDLEGQGCGPDLPVRVMWRPKGSAEEPKVRAVEQIRFSSGSGLVLDYTTGRILGSR